MLMILLYVLAFIGFACIWYYALRQAGIIPL
jgi:hypothetical protein